MKDILKSVVVLTVSGVLVHLTIQEINERRARQKKY